jgi:hypothetical protein
MRLGYVGRVEEANRSDLDSHADWCVCGKEVLVFNYFDHEVTFTCWDPEVETQSLWIVSAALGYTMPAVSKDCALDCSSEHLESNFESQLTQHHANETA